MQIHAEKLAKRYHKQWLFRDVDLKFQSGERTVLLGPNGSGKSTLLKILSGNVAPTQGEVKFINEDGSDPDIGQWHKYFALCAPYLELIEEYTLKEHLDFHFRLKRRCEEVVFEAMLDRSGLRPAMGKRVKDFSSGMKQRLKLLLSLCSEVQVYFLDEPCTNLDEQGFAFYKYLIERLSGDRVIIVASNDPREYDFCPNRIDLSSL